MAPTSATVTATPNHPTDASTCVVNTPTRTPLGTRTRARSGFRAGRRASAPGTRTSFRSSSAIAMPRACADTTFPSSPHRRNLRLPLAALRPPPAHPATPRGVPPSSAARAGAGEHAVPQRRHQADRRREGRRGQPETSGDPLVTVGPPVREVRQGRRRVGAIPLPPDAPGRRGQGAALEEPVLPQDDDIHEVADPGVLPVTEPAEHGVELLGCVAVG